MKFKPAKHNPKAYTLAYFKQSFELILTYFNLACGHDEEGWYWREGLKGMWTTFITMLKGEPQLYEIEDWENEKD